MGPCREPEDEADIENVDISGDSQLIPGARWEEDPESPVVKPGTDDNIVRDGSVSLLGGLVERTKTGGWRAAVLILMLITGDALTILGIAANLLPYFVQVLHISDIDLISNIVNSYVGLTYILPVAWGYFADTFFGRYVTIVASVIISIVGLLVLTLSASLKGLRPDKCLDPLSCPPATSSQLNWLYAGLFTIAIGSAGMKPCLSSLGRDQFDATHPSECKAGGTFFQCMYLGAAVTIAFGVTLGFYVQDSQGFGLGWGLVSLYFLLTALSFFSGTLLYRHRKPQGSMLTRLAQVFIVALKNVAKPLPPWDELYDFDDKAYKMITAVKLAHTDRLRFLEKAAIVPSQNDHKSTFDSWEVCTLTQVEELKCIIQILPVWACTIIVSLLNAQVVTVAVSASLTLDRRLGKHFVIPAGSINIFYLLGTIVFFPVYDYVLVPILVKITGHPKGLSDLRRIGVALFLALVAMVIAAVVDGRRVHIIKAYFQPSDYDSLSQGDTTLPMSIFWMVPQFALLGAVVYLLNVAQLNFFYGETPENMRSVATSLYFTSISIGYFAATGFQKAVNSITYKKAAGGGWVTLGGEQIFQGGLQKFYYMTAVLTAINLVLFVASALWYTNKVVKVEDETPSLEAHIEPARDIVDSTKKANPICLSEVMCSASSASST